MPFTRQSSNNFPSSLNGGNADFRPKIRHVAFSMIGVAVFVASLNLWMNFVGVYRMPTTLQLDMSANGDVMGFHQLDGSAAHPKFPFETHPRNSRRRHHVELVDDMKASHNRCPGLCPPTGSSESQLQYIASLVSQRLRHMPADSFKLPLSSGSKSNIPPNSAQFDQKTIVNSQFLQEKWSLVASWVSARHVSPPNLNTSVLKSLITAVSQARVENAEVPTKGTQLKVLLSLQGGQKALFKPMWFARDFTTDPNEPYGGADRHNGEVVAFYLSLLLGLNRTPIAVGRRVNLRREIMQSSNPQLKSTFFEDPKSGRLCFYGKCHYCNEKSPVCSTADGFLEGAVILWLPDHFNKLDRVRSPWARTYDKAKLAKWETDFNFCSTIESDGIFGRKPVLLDLIDTAVFDWLIGNADRHHLEWFSGVEPKMILLLDNGKSFGNPSVDELTILAPLYQCCRLRAKLYYTLLELSQLNLASRLDEWLRLDPIYPLLTYLHFEAINRRLRKVLIVVSQCVEMHGAAYVLQDDGF